MEVIDEFPHHTLNGLMVASKRGLSFRTRVETSRSSLLPGFESQCDLFLVFLVFVVLTFSLMNIMHELA